MATLPYIKTQPKLIFFTDFDGTITVDDSECRRDLVTDAFREMLGSIKTPYDQCIETLLKNMKLDPFFEKFYYWAKENNVPIVILSSGMKPIISALLERFLGHTPAEHLTIVSNDVTSRDGKDINSEGGWQITYHDESHFGHDKSLEIKPYAALPEGQRPILLYAGDGVSDLSAAAETNLLFAKQGKDLVTFCERRGMPYTTFENWSTILSTTQDILSGKVSPSDVAK
ncbi:hypothetical protein N7492_004677 [Penicillium capsulatum]|uniref:Phosphoserine phosphatase n=1 Tax=Penicillium capsulatum TaxID=69766 RepID=A0A9W9IAB4_9EURO|nr:hypothetical protein N7492_004677 [Penicillium capsulatum]